MKNLFEIEELELRNYDGVFKLIDCKVEDRVDNIDVEEWHYKTASATYHDEKRNNTLYLSEIRYEGEEMEDISVVVNAISNEAYLYLINVLNTNENVSVHGVRYMEQQVIILLCMINMEKIVYMTRII